MSKTTLPEYRTDDRTGFRSDSPACDDVSLAECESLLVCLYNGRFVVVRPAEPKDFWPLNGGWEKVRHLAAGDEVIYKGEKTVVRAVDVYR